MFQAGDFSALALILAFSIAAFFIAGHLERVIAIKNEEQAPEYYSNEDKDFGENCYNVEQKKQDIPTFSVYNIDNCSYVTALRLGDTEQKCISVVGLK